jgi:gliding motility-associated-like protein
VTITYNIFDADGDSDSGTVTFTVGAVNDAPVANDDEAETLEGAPVTIAVLDNDSDVDGDGLVVISTSSPENGSVVINDDGTITYTPNENFDGTDTFTYTVSDGNGGTATATVTVSVVGGPEPPSIFEVVQPTCELPSGTITIDVIEGLSYSIDGENYQNSGEFVDLPPGTYNITAQDSNGLISDITEVVLNDPEIVEIQTSSVDLCIEDNPFNLFDLLLGEYDDSGTWEASISTQDALSGSILDPSQLNVGSYIFNYVTEGACASTTAVQVGINDDCIVLNCSIDDIKNSISKVVTPNGDRRNDFFEINIDPACGFTFNVEIYNRWGAKIFGARNYNNNWDGFSNKSTYGSNQLPAGTYFYIVEVNGGGFNPIQGYIYLGTK